MSSKISVLLVEDSEADAELIVEVLKQGGMDLRWRRVDTEATYVEALDVPPDLILSDFSLPGFDGKTALNLMKRRGLDIPFIIVSGCIGEEAAVECMKAGASDYLLKDRLGRLAHAVGQVLERKRLIDEKRQVEQRLFLESFHDSLTGLPNRTLFLDRLDKAVSRHRRDAAHLFAVLYLSLEGFKIVHDSLGHGAADRLLVHVSQRLLRRVRSSDTLTRIGTEDFAFLLDSLKMEEHAARVAERVRQEFASPFVVDDQEIFLTASLGVTSSIGHYKDAEAALRDATTAMHRAKAAGRSGFAIFDPAMHEQAMTRLRLETDLRLAIDRHEFRLHYQPIIAMTTGEMAGCEALLRWQHPEQGLLSPPAFLTIADEIGLLDTLTEWSCGEACRQLRAWQAAFPAVRPLSVSVNLTAKNLAHPQVVENIRRMVKSSGVEPRSLKIEVTESELMDNPEAVRDVLHELGDLGVESCLDDFGTGYSSLSYLQRLPITFLKIDQSFVRRLGTEDDALAIITAIVMLAHQLGRQVIAEGVEMAEQRSLLSSLGCEYAQGYLFAKALPPEGITQLLQHGARW
jgi:diguanylate cyclase (GGDEF)-like protein